MKWREKWREKWSEKCSEISSRAGGFPRPLFHQGVALTYKSVRHSKAMLCTGGYPQTPFFIRALPCGGYHEGAHRAIALAGGYPQTPFSSGLCPVGDTPKPRRRLCLQPSHLTQPSLTIREGFEPLPKPLANRSCVPLVASGKAERARGCN